MRILKRHRTLLAAGALCALLPQAAQAEDAPKPAQEKPSAYVLKTYDVRALTSSLTDWPGPASLLNPREQTAAAGNDPFATQPAAAGLSPADVATLIQEKYLPNDFANQRNSSITEQKGQLVVMQTPDVHAKIPALLRTFQRQFKRRVSVQALEVAVDAAEAVRWLGKAGAAVPQKNIDAYFAKDSGVTVVAAPQVSAFSGQRTHVFAGETATYTADLDVIGSAYSPEVKTRYEGGLFDVTPVLSATGASVALNLRYGRRTPIASGADTFVFASTLGKGAKPTAAAKVPAGDPKSGAAKPENASGSKPAGAAIGGTIDLPKAQVRTLSTDLNLPTGTWILAATLDPVAGAAEGSAESKWLLLFLRCEELVGNGGL